MYANVCNGHVQNVYEPIPVYEYALDEEYTLDMTPNHYRAHTPIPHTLIPVGNLESPISLT